MFRKIVIFSMILAVSCAIAPWAFAAVSFNDAASSGDFSSSDADKIIKDAEAEAARIEQQGNADAAKDLQGTSMAADEDGFLMGDNLNFNGEEAAAEEKPKPRQVYRGDAANRPKMEAPRTHLMYEPTRY